jgi:thioredoxin 2
MPARSGRLVRCPTCDTRNRVPTAADGRPRCGSCREPLPWAVDATDDTFAHVVESSAIPVLVDLWAPWCGPCQMVSPAVERMALKYRGRLKVAKVNVDTSPGVAARFEARSIPTLLLVKKGRVADRLVGAVPEPQLDAWVSRHV